MEDLEGRSSPALVSRDTGIKQHEVPLGDSASKAPPDPHEQSVASGKQPGRTGSYGSLSKQHGRSSAKDSSKALIGPDGKEGERTAGHGAASHSNSAASSSRIRLSSKDSVKAPISSDDQQVPDGDVRPGQGGSYGSLSKQHGSSAEDSSKAPMGSDGQRVNNCEGQSDSSKPSAKAAAAGSESSGESHHPGKFSQFVRDVQQKLKLRGLEEIHKEHPLNQMATCMKRGLQKCHRESSGEVSIYGLSQDDYSEVETHSVTMDNSNKNVKFRSYSPAVFEALRNSLGIKSTDYNKTLEVEPYLQYKSNSRNGQIFFLCNDKQYFLKTENAKDAKFLLRILRSYVGHLSYYPHSLIVRILGLHYIKLPGKKGKFFSVMQSVFHPEGRIYARYDLKGCIANRYVKPEKEDSEFVTVLKDVNFGEQKLSLATQKDWFLHQIEIDSKFLQGFNIMDYSLLVGRQTLHFTEMSTNDGLAGIVQRIVKSVPHDGPPPGQVHTKDASNNSSQRIREQNQRVEQEHINDDHDRHNPLIENNQAGMESNGSNTGEQREQDKENTELPGMVNRGHMNNDNEDVNANKSTIQYNTNPRGENDDPVALKMAASGEDETIDEADALRNQRLLPNVANASHVIDGTDDRYFVGIIDILGQYTLKKRMETILKYCISPRTPFSSVNSAKYARRFRDFIAKHTE